MLYPFHKMLYIIFYPYINTNTSDHLDLLRHGDLPCRQPYAALANQVALTPQGVPNNLTTRARFRNVT